MEWKIQQSKYGALNLGRGKKSGKNTPSETGATPKPTNPGTEQVEEGTEDAEAEKAETEKAEEEVEEEPEQPRTVCFHCCSCILLTV